MDQRSLPLKKQRYGQVFLLTEVRARDFAKVPLLTYAMAVVRTTNGTYD